MSLNLRGTLRILWEGDRPTLPTEVVGERSTKSAQTSHCRACERARTPTRGSGGLRPRRAHASDESSFPSSSERELVQSFDHVRRCLHQLDQDAFSAERCPFISLRMNEADVVAARALANSAGSEAHALFLEPLHRHRQVVHPQPDVVARFLEEAASPAAITPRSAVATTARPSTTTTGPPARCWRISSPGRDAGRNLG